jgi:exodeoxyribonuclease VII small subunit
MAAESTSSQESFDQVLARLKAVVERLEGGQLSLEQALEAFEEGVRLARRGNEVLDAAEKRVEILTRGPGGEVRSGPFTAND